MDVLLKQIVPRTITQIFGAKHKFKQRTPSSVINFTRTMTTNRGALIVFEGCDHSGKTTQCNKLISSMNEKGLSVKSMRFPDRTTTIGQMISSYLGNTCEIEDHAVHLLFSANRWEMSEHEKLLQSGTTLIVDRYAYSGVAFTSAKQGFDMQWCKQPDIGLPKPDAVIYLTLSPEAAEKRGTFGKERYEKKEFQQKVSENFEKLKEDNWKVIDADKSVDDLHTELCDIVCEVIDAAQDKPLEQLWVDN
ncbi:hypothetical protein KUTeg_011629 [Tegillarca granosa]|uniref:dTMP kinase n=1 Tax=Tegillarca granosa TaxID=220873 RepID=A0ABQ9EXH1_TEGGR|nr:hypothetical protein KUTeg_011629 [Tegillarca granosa]